MHLCVKDISLYKNKLNTQYADYVVKARHLFRPS